MKTRIILLCIICLAAGSGCAIISSNSSTTLSGVQVSNDTLTQLELGKTTKAWVIASLGQPSSASQVDEKTEILKYTSKRTKKQSSGLILVISTNNETEEKETVYFEFESGILQRYWKSND